jgi:predicted nuclease of predicted toxin-antitoxin system
MDIRLLADMNISPKTVEAMRKRGWDILRVSNFLPANASDQQILQFARQENRILITQDLDFSALLALAGENQPSLVTLRLSISDPETITKKLLDILPRLKDELQAGCVVTIQDTTVRFRRLPIQIL